MDTSLNYKHLIRWCYLVAQKKITGKTKNGENVPSLEVVEVILVQCNLVDNQYQQKSEVLDTFTLNECYTYLSNVETITLVLWKTYKTEFVDITVTSTDQNIRWLEVEHKVDLTFLINKQRQHVICHLEETCLTNMDYNYWILQLKQD